MITRICLFSLLLCSYANAGLISIPLKDNEYKLAPASDLVHEGKRINEVEAMELEKRGFDISSLDPYESDLFNPMSKEENFNPEFIQEVTFHSFLQSPTEFFRFASKSGQKNLTLTASLFNHETVARSNLLRKVGYKIPKIFYQHEVKVHFSSVSLMNMFIEKIVESTLISQKKWIIEENKNELYLRLRGLTLEPADSKSVPVYWPIMEETRQRKRRIYRSLLYLYTLTDFNMPINEISWNAAKLFNNELIISHPFSEEFSSVTIADIKWLHRKIVSLSSDELCEGIIKNNYPEDIGKLLCEKLKSRINSFGKVINLSAPFEIDQDIETNQVKKGKLTSGDYPNYVPSFWINDVESPFRFSEIFKFFRNQMTYDTISNLLTTAEKEFLPGITTETAYKNIIEKVKEFGRKHGTVPIKVWSRPTINGAVGGNRSIVFGKYDGNDAPIQLVDTLDIRLKVGLFNFLSIPGAPVLPTATLNAQLVRSWKHIKAMPDLSTATNQKINNLLIPKLYRTLGKVLKNEYTCSLQQDAWVSEEIISGIGIWVVNYSKVNESAKENALALRLELIEKGIPKSKILLRPTDKEELCSKEITEKRNNSIDKFLKSFAMDETLTVTDSFEAIAGVGIKANDSITNGIKLQVGLDGGRAVLRTYIIRRIESGLEITIQNQKDLSARFYQDIKFFISLLSNSTNWTNGDLFAKVYRVNFDDVDDEQKKLAINVIREIFLRSSYGLLSDHYNAIEMNHDVRARINTFKFFWRKNERLKMNHEVNVMVPYRETKRETPQTEDLDEWTIPVQPIQDLTIKERTKNLFSTMILKRKGNNYHAFLNQILNDQYTWLSTGSQQTDPGQSIKGKSFHRYIVTEGDLTPDSEFNPVTKIEFGNAGWSVDKKNLERYLEKHEQYLSTYGDTFTIDRAIFNQTSSLRSYNIRTTIILYPSATDKILEKIIKSEEIESISELKNLYGAKEWEEYCRLAEEAGNGQSLFQSLDHRNSFFCVPTKLHNILRIRKDGILLNRKERGIQINKIVELLIDSVQQKNFLTWISKEHFFGNTYISGFRNGDAIGYLQYGSDSVGTYNKDLMTGIFDQIAALLGVRPYNLKGMVYTPNM